MSNATIENISWSRAALARTLLVILFFAGAILGIQAQNRQLVQDDKITGKRIALVIGNGAYTKAKPLPNPANDGRDMAATLKSLGFEVLSGIDLDKRAMENLIREFGGKLTKGSVGLFYYAGHGVQVGGENYLVPVDADIPAEDEVSYASVSVNLVLRKMATTDNDLNVIILDACRNNPFARSWRGGSRDASNDDGLAKISPPTGTLVLYATEPGKVASDGTGKNGLFTEALLKQIKTPNLEYDQLVRAVSVDVWQKSNKQQLPWKEGNSLADFYFNPQPKIAGAAVNPPPNDNRQAELKVKTPPLLPSTANMAKKIVGAISKSKLSNNVEMSFAYVPAGEFQMGDVDNAPVHTVKLSRGFSMQQTEVTQAQWKAVVGGLPSKCDYGELKGEFLGDDKPMMCVSWEEAQEFVRQMNSKKDGFKYRLPTEAEWEYAARAGTTGDFAGYSDAIAWHSENSDGHPHQVATKRANDWNLYDMHGNLAEWVQDWFGYYPNGSVTDPTGVKDGSSKIIRGGSFKDLAERQHSANRAADIPSSRTQDTGFRVVRE